MADLTGQLIANSYKNLLQAPGTGGGIGSGQYVTIQDGSGVQLQDLLCQQTGVQVIW
jgi:hypothetical protein